MIQLPPPSEAFVVMQMRRLEALDFRPATEESLREVKLALLRAKHNREVEEIVTTWLAEQRNYPKPADVHNMLYCRRIDEGEATKPLGDVHCLYCRGTGFRIVARGRYEGADPCSCRPREKP